MYCPMRNRQKRDYVLMRQSRFNYSVSSWIKRARIAQRLWPEVSVGIRALGKLHISRRTKTLAFRGRSRRLLMLQKTGRSLPRREHEGEAPPSDRGSNAFFGAKMDLWQRRQARFQHRHVKSRMDCWCFERSENNK